MRRNADAAAPIRQHRDFNRFRSPRSAGLGALLAIGLALGPVENLRAQTSISQPGASATVRAGPLSAEFQREVLRRLILPADAVAAYAGRLQGALVAAGVAPETPQFIALVDRNPNVQALMLYWGSATTGWSFIGAAPV